MKFDRFTKVLLMLIVMLLAFSCARDLGRQSNSGGGANNSSPLDILRPTPAQAQSQAKWEYYWLYVSGASPDVGELNRLGAEGWEVAGIAGIGILLKRRTN